MPLPHTAIGKYGPDFLPLLGRCVLLSLLVLSCTMGPQVLKADQPISLLELEALCRLPAPCGEPMACHGETVTVWGYVDPLNIFSKQRSPGIPYEKFKVVDHGGRAIEVWPQAADNRPIFNKLARRPTDRIAVTGKVLAFEMPISGQCLQGVKVLIDEASQIDFK